jgi:hypothetical protein
MRQRDNPANNSHSLNEPHLQVLSEATLKLPRRTKHTDYFSITRVKHASDRFELIITTKGRTEHSATLLLAETSHLHARKLLEILTAKKSISPADKDPVPAITIVTTALTYAGFHNMAVTTPDGRRGHDALAHFFDEEIKHFSMPLLQRMVSVEGLGNGIYHLSFPNQFLMNASFVRLQEHFESPKFRGKLFTHEEFRAWYRSTREHKEFSYYTDWGGFNIPGYVLTPFLNGRFDPLRPEEQALVETFRGMQGPLYIIGTLETDRISTLRHELAHALYHTNPTYRREVDTILDGINCNPLHRLLKSMGYHAAQWRDEAHAYLGDEPWELEAQGVNPLPYAKVRRELLRVYNKHSPIRHSR